MSSIHSEDVIQEGCMGCTGKCFFCEDNLSRDSGSARPSEPQLLFKHANFSLVDAHTPRQKTPLKLPRRFFRISLHNTPTLGCPPKAHWEAHFSNMLGLSGWEAENLQCALREGAHAKCKIWKSPLVPIRPSSVCQARS